MKNPDLCSKSPVLFWIFDNEEQANQEDSYFQWNAEPLEKCLITADRISFRVSGDGLLPEGVVSLRRNSKGAYIGKGRYISDQKPLGSDRFWFARAESDNHVILVGRWAGERNIEGNAIAVLPKAQSPASNRRMSGK